ncbi:MAG: 16S rRNA (guanine(527)-N(7))-methyltransferase RsmG [Propionibacteriaceae bacterium]|nr:16S rRNA (guanine(527)-N(7))-methyltransferase RsmG [Propionibacteriaceae bacterium]
MDEAVIASVFGEGSETISQYVDILANRGIDWGLIGPRERDRLWERHILNSVALSPRIPNDASVVDVGSGAGLPGVPLAVQRADLKVTLLEPLLRRVNFLNLVVSELELSGRVQVVRGRAEETRGRYDVVTCRAVAPLPRLLGWCLPLVLPGGRLLALKGSSAHDEVVAAKDELRRRKVRVEVHRLPVPGVDGESTWVVEVDA